MNGPSPIRSQLGRFATGTARPEDLDALRRRCYIEQNIAVLVIDEIANDYVKQGVINEMGII